MKQSLNKIKESLQIIRFLKFPLQGGVGFLILLFMVSCAGNNPIPPYVYEANPHYSFGYAEFFGPYYNRYGNPNNVVSLSLFSDSLKITKDGSLVGYGQYLFLEDIFISAESSELPAGTYTIDSTGLKNTVAPGLNDTIDDEVYILGATISYYEKNTTKSTLKRITSGTFNLAKTGGMVTITCDFKTADNKDLDGSFTGELTYYDRSLDITRLPVNKRTRFLKPW
ncbi:MAG TPA: hypothetical protein VK152_08760 [Paludibacter sp.]|nr:hypothetical protein [Paludibacter sp.]